MTHDEGGELRAIADDALAVAEERSSWTGALLAGFVHDMNNPLAAILANLEVAQGQLAGHGAPGTSELAATLADARIAAERMRDVVADLGVLGRRHDDEPSDVDLNVALQAALRLCRAELRHRASVHTAIEDVPRIHVSEAGLGLALLELIVHVAHAFPVGNPTANLVRVVTRLRDADRVSLELTAWGPGLTEETRRRLFALDGSDRRAALGVRLCDLRMARCGGTLELGGDVGRGTIVVTWPVAKVGTAATRCVARARDHEPAVRRVRVLVIDDEASVRAVIHRVLSALHEVETVGAATDALERIRAGERFDVVLCDLMMPSMTGMDFYEELSRTHPELLERVGFLSGGTFTERARRFVEEVPNVVLEKPFDGRRLREVVASIASLGA